MKLMTRLLALCIAAMLLTPLSLALAGEDGYSSTYTYNYDFWNEMHESPDAYRVEQVIYSGTLGLETAMRRPQSLFVQGNDLYVCDTGNNRILQLRRRNGQFSLVRIIDSVKGVEPSTFSTPNDVAVDAKGNIYVADYNNNRVVMMDKNLNFVRAYLKPEDSTFDQNLSFLPSKIVVDTSGRVFVLATNVNKGLVKYEADGTFTGFIGANQVSYNLWDYIWKTFFTTKEQRSQQAAFVPTEYENIYIDQDGFIYATNTVFSEYDLESDVAKPIRRLNSIGNDILIKNDKRPPIGDSQWVEGNSDYGPSKFKDITVLDNDIYIALDRTRGRIFGYDPQGFMLWAFGTKGNSEGAFMAAVSIEHMGTDLFVLDENDCSITVFTPTEYGSLIYEASNEYLKGDYDGSAETWREVLKLNANYNLAFIGIGRALMRQEEYGEALNYFKMAHDRTNYGRAYRYYRKELVESYIGPIVAVVVALIVILLVVKFVKKMKAEVAENERRKINA
ncbi:MAG: NHL repeat-containing protein [Christensenellaceae bacterium]|nr:NHL repeat-containing protein [Christensenellaceae bacterium]